MANDKTQARKLNRRAQTTIKAQSFIPSDDQISDARRFLLVHLKQEEMNPASLAAGGRLRVIELLRVAINDGEISDIPRNPPESTMIGLYERTLGLGIIEVLLANPAVEQINLLGAKQILVQSNGTWGAITDPKLLFTDDTEYRRVIDNLVRRVGKELSPQTNPIVDIRFDAPVLRIHINLLVRGNGLAVFIRRGRDQPFPVAYLLKAGNFDQAVANMLIEAAKRLIGCVFIGPVGTGKTVMLEMYIDHMPNVPIVVADDAGDCSPSHPFCVVNDLPGTAYSVHDTQIITLAGMIKAGLREGDVLVIAELRGAEETGIAISNAPRMRCVVSSFHGDTVESGLSSMVSTAQTPPSPYAGMDREPLASSVATAFPLVVQMDRSGDIRFVSGIYHNRGWKDGGWDLYPLATAVYGTDGSITWTLHGTLDDVKEDRVLDRISRVKSLYEASDPRQLYKAALENIEQGEYASAKHHLYQCLRIDDTEITRNKLIEVLESTGEAATALSDAKNAASTLTALVDKKDWKNARKLLSELNKRTSRVFMRRVLPKYSSLLPLIDKGAKETERATQALETSLSLIGTKTRWDIIALSVEEIDGLSSSLINSKLHAQLQKVHIALLTQLVEDAPPISRDHFSEQLKRSTNHA